MPFPQISRNTYIVGGSVLLGILGVTFFVRRARAKEADKKAIEAPPAVGVPVPPVVMKVETKPAPQRQPTSRPWKPIGFTDLPKFKTSDFTIPKPPRLQRRPVDPGMPRPGRRPRPTPALKCPPGKTAIATGGTRTAPEYTCMTKDEATKWRRQRAAHRARMKAAREFQAEFNKFKAIQDMTPEQREEARRKAMAKRI